MFSKLINCFAVVICLTISTGASAAITSKDWMNYLSQSCKPTISGKAKRLFGELDFWAHVDVSMDQWAQDMRLDSPQTSCAYEYQASRDKEKYMQCLAYYKEKWEWFSRCKPLVVQMCRQAGGHC